MITYCPTCANMLLVELAEGNKDLQYICQTCPYVYLLDRKITKKVHLPKTAVQSVLPAWDASKTMDVPCPAPGCGNVTAMYHTMQVRVGDEPATTFFRCEDCGEEWQEDAAKKER